MNTYYYLISIMVMGGLTLSIACLLAFPTKWNYFHIIFFNIIGVYIIYKSLKKANENT